MRDITRRVTNLETKFGLKGGEPAMIQILSGPHRPSDLDDDACMKMIKECGLLPTAAGPGIHFVNLLNLPRHLSPDEFRKFLRKHGAEATRLRARTATHNPEDWRHYVPEEELPAK
jgi:hypothetical protein